jgi:hypothetical protein
MKCKLCCPLLCSSRAHDMLLLWLLMVTSLQFFCMPLYNALQCIYSFCYILFNQHAKHSMEIVERQE